jgi:hypothetical protein
MASSPNMHRHSLKRLFPARVLIFWLTIAIALSVLSGTLTQWWNASPYVPVRIIFIVVFSTFAGYFLLLFILGVSSTGWVERNMLPFRDSLTRTSFIISTLLALSLAVLVILMSNGFSIRNSINNPGGMFAITSGVATFVGVYITLQSIHELRQTISSFPELVDRVCNLVDSTRATTPGGDFLRFMAFTPFIGSLSLPQREWNKLRTRLLAHTDKIEIICLDKDDMKAFHQLFLGRVTDRGKITQEIINSVYGDTEWILDSWNGPKKPKRKAQDRLPGYYLFANSRRAILAMPFFMPLPSDSLNQDAIQDLPPVQMFGFETGDSGIVQSVHRMFDLYAEDVPDHTRLCGDLTGTLDEVKLKIEQLAREHGPQRIRLTYKLEAVSAASGLPREAQPLGGPDGGASA